MQSKKLLLLSLKALGISAILIVAVNLISAALSAVQLNEPLNSFYYKHGLFEVNGKAVGMNFVELKYWLFYIALFILVFSLLYRKSLRNFKIKQS